MKRVLTGLLVIMTFWLAGCAMNGYQAIREADYPVTHRMFDLTMGWKTRVTADTLFVDGYVRNTRYFIISDMDMTVSLIDKNGREKAKDDFSFLPRELEMDDSSRFGVLLRARPEAGDMIRFQYRYDAEDARNGGFTWRHSFQVPALQEGN